MNLVDKIAIALYNNSPQYSWLGWGDLSDEGKRPYRERAQIALDVTVDHFGIPRA